jgi:hypothetical protein
MGLNVHVAKASLVLHCTFLRLAYMHMRILYRYIAYFWHLFRRQLKSILRAHIPDQRAINTDAFKMFSPSFWYLPCFITSSFLPCRAQNHVAQCGTRIYRYTRSMGILYQYTGVLSCQIYAWAGHTHLTATSGAGGVRAQIQNVPLKGILYEKCRDEVPKPFTTKGPG